MPATLSKNHLQGKHSQKSHGGGGGGSVEVLESKFNKKASGINKPSWGLDDEDELDAIAKSLKKAYAKEKTPKNDQIVGIADNQEGETLQTFATNIGTSRVREEELNGRRYLVAPVVLINPGVLNGSQGPLLYPEDEVKDNPGVWNNVPITHGHPVDEDGKPTSARSPKTLNRVGLGYLFNDRFSKGKRRADAWFDVERTKKIDPTLLENVRKGLKVEVSTGLFTKNVPARKGATHNGRPYSATARSYGPDHLAVLTKTRGACSVTDGCGLNVTNQEQETEIEATTSNQGESDMDREFLLNVLGVEEDDMITENGPKKGKKFSEMEDEELTALCASRVSARNEEHEELVTMNQAFQAYAEKTGCVFNEESGEVECAGDRRVVDNEGDEVSADEWLQAAPQEIRNAVEFGRKAQEEYRASLIEAVTTNSDLDADFLANETDERLEVLAKQFTKNEKKPARRLSQWPTFSAGGAPTANQKQDLGAPLVPLTP